MKESSGNRLAYHLDTLRLLAFMLAFVCAAAGLVCYAGNSIQTTEGQWQLWHHLTGWFLLAAGVLMAISGISWIAINRVKSANNSEN